MKPVLVLSGRGARGAYQVGALKAIANAHKPFSIIGETSANAVSALAQAAVANSFRMAAKKVSKVCRFLDMDQVYGTGARALLKGVERLLASFCNRGSGRKWPLLLLNIGSLRDPLERNIQLRKIKDRIYDVEYVSGISRIFTASTTIRTIQHMRSIRMEIPNTTYA